jgi:tetratricopeptide (TPR) repeat protein/DNA-binding winged helix-turn-helix (wHTH) protein
MKLVGNLIYRLEDIEIDTSRGCLNRNGQEQYLRLQTFQVLLYLVEHRERVVTKDELIENIWQQTAVTDNTLVQCIVDIRKALGDDSHQPRFIKTIPKVGYRFIGRVQERGLSEATTAALGEPLSEQRELGEKPNALSTLERPQSLPASTKPGWFSQRRAVASFSVVGLVLAVALWVMLWDWGQPHAEFRLPHIPGKKPLAVMFFENQSASSDLNWLREGLADMLITNLAHSDKLTVLSRQQLHALLERIDHKATDRIRLDDALDIARRSHAEAIVLGSFAVLDKQIRVDVQLHDARHGQLIAAERLVVDNPGEILTRIDLLSLKLESHLGVAPTEHDKKTGLAEVMTDNLEAYRYYSLGLEKAHTFENAQAIELLQKAIELDPKFAMAYARIGYAYAVTDFLPEKGRPYLEKAFNLSDRLTEKDKLYITAWYAIARRDYPSAIRTFRQIIAQFPFEIEAYRRLARLLYGEEQTDEAVRVIKQGLAVDPEAKELYNGLGMFYLGLGKYDEAIAMHQRYVALAPREPNAHDSLGMSYQQSGRHDQAVAEYTEALALNPEFEPAIIHLGDVYFQQGRYQEAIRQYQRYIQVTRSDLARALGYSSIAHVYRRKGDIQRAEQAAMQEMKYEKGAVWNTLVLALEQGDRARVEQSKRKLFERLPYPQRGARHDLRSYDYFRGYLALKGGRAAEAIAHFQEALRHLPPTSGIDLYEDCLANAYLEVGRLDEAINEYQRVLRLNPRYPLAHYHLGQAYKRQGKHDLAKAAYERFLQVWKDADADIPEVIDAKRRGVTQSNDYSAAR